MSKKIWYSKTLTYFWEKYHRDYEKFKLDPASLYAKIKKDIHFNYPVHLMPEENTKEILGTELWYSDYKNELTHLYFIDKYLKDFLFNTKLSDLEGIKQFLKDNGTEQQVIITKTQDKENLTIYSFAVHIPYEKYGYAFSLSLDQDLKLTLLFCKGETLSVIPENQYHILKNSSDKTSRFNANTFRLAINILAYMNCFPNCIRDGVPPNLHDEYESKGTKTISLSKKVIESTLQKTSGKILAPHFRKGCFKLLKSDYYTHKKGQLIFFRETMVKGKAKTVYTADELTKFE